MIGIAVLLIAAEMMKGDPQSAASAEGKDGSNESATKAGGETPGNGTKQPLVPAAAAGKPDVQPNPGITKPDLAPPVAPMPKDETAVPVDAPDAMPDEPNETEPEMPKPNPGDADPPATVQPKPRPPAPIDDPRTKSPDTPGSAVAEMTKALADAKAALVARDVENAKTQLTVAASMANAPDHKAMVKRLELLTHFVGEFWKGVGDGIKGLDGVDELLVGELRVSVVEHSDDDLTIRAGGKNLHYTIDDLPSGLAEVLFERVREMKDPLNKMSKGAFHAVDKNRSVETAKRIFQEAQLSGGDVADLMAVVDDKYDVKNPPVARAVPQKRHLPDPTALTEATGQVKAKYGKDITAARTPQQKYDLAKKIMGDAAMPMDNEATRLALFNESRDLAANAHLAQLTVQIIDETEKWFEIDVLATKFDALSKAAVRASPQAARDIALECLQLTDQAEEAKRLDLADKFVRVAGGTARASRDTDLAKRATDRLKDVQKAFREASAEKPDEKPGNNPSEKPAEGGADKDAAAKPPAA